jgi:hypothetical protein
MSQLARSPAGSRWGHFVDLLTVMVAVITIVVAIRVIKAPTGSASPLPDRADIERGIVGRVLDTLAIAERGEGSGSRVAFRGVPHLVFLFRSDCRACRVTEPAWLRLISEIDSSVVIQALTLGRDEASDPQLGHSAVPVGRPTSQGEFDRVFALPTVVPVTLLVSADGVVRYARVGALTSADVDSILTAASNYVFAGN